MNDFEKFAFDEVCAALADIEPAAAQDIYVLSFYVSDFDDDPRRPMLQLGYNTDSRRAECTPAKGETAGWPIASSAEEAKWNFAFWLQNELKLIGEPATPGGRLFEDLLKAKGLWYSDEDEEADFERCERVAGGIIACFVDACVRVARELHATGAIERRFGRPVPIVIHELEYYDEIALQTRLANPPGLAKEFEDWIAGMYQRLERGD